MVNLVADQTDSVRIAPTGDGLEFVGVQHGACRIAGAGNDQTVRGRVEPVKHRHARLKAGVGPSFEDDRLHAECGEDVHVGRVEGRRQRDPVAWIEGGEEGEWETT